MNRRNWTPFSQNGIKLTVMKKLIIYSDTSVIGGCLDPEFAHYSNLLIDEFVNGSKTCLVSNITLKELETAPEKVKEIFKKIQNASVEFCSLDTEAEDLALAYIKEGAVSNNFLVDAQHIAISTINNADVLVSWNFKHIVNIHRIRQYNAVNMKYGYQPIEIRTPMEVVDEA